MSSLPYDKTRAESKGNNQPGTLVRGMPFSGCSVVHGHSVHDTLGRRNNGMDCRIPKLDNGDNIHFTVQAREANMVLLTKRSSFGGIVKLADRTLLFTPCHSLLSS